MAEEQFDTVADFEVEPDGTGGVRLPGSLALDEGVPQRQGKDDESHDHGARQSAWPMRFAKKARHRPTRREGQEGGDRVGVVGVTSNGRGEA